MALPSPLEVQLRQVMSVPPAKAVPSCCEPVSMSCILQMSAERRHRGHRPLKRAEIDPHYTVPDWDPQHFRIE